MKQRVLGSTSFSSISVWTTWLHANPLHSSPIHLAEKRSKKKICIICYFALSNIQEVVKRFSYLESKGLKHHEVVSSTEVGYHVWRMKIKLCAKERESKGLGLSAAKAKCKPMCTVHRLTFTCSVKSSAELKVFRQMC